MVLVVLYERWIIAVELIFVWCFWLVCLFVPLALFVVMCWMERLMVDFDLNCVLCGVASVDVLLFIYLSCGVVVCLRLICLLVRLFVWSFWFVVLDLVSVLVTTCLLAGCLHYFIIKLGVWVLILIFAIAWSGCLWLFGFVFD